MGPGERRYPLLFSPGAFGRLTLRNRILAAPMEKNLANPDGSVTERYLDYVRERARGGAALLSPESLFIDPRGKANPLQLGIHSDGMVPGLRSLCEAVHAEGALAMAELNHAGRQASSAITGLQPVGPSPIPFRGFRPGEVPRELGGGEIADILRSFAAAAARAREAGFDAVQVHGAHGYLVGQFLSPRSNRRQDAYGGDLAGRMRFPLEVVAAVRAAVGEDFPLACRLSADEGVEGGTSLEDILTFCEALEREGVDLIDVSAGTYESAHLITPSMEAPLACHVSLAEHIKARVRVPVSVAGRILDGETAEEILRSGRADFVTMGRALHADPYLPRKTQEGRADEVRPCVGCLKCSDLLGVGEVALCLANSSAAQEREAAIRPAALRKRVLVVGGGPAGLEAARVAALRGHDVVLSEMAGELGGQLRHAARAPGRADLASLVRSLEGEVRRLGVEVRLWSAVDAEMVGKLAPDEVVLASGALAGAPPVRGAESRLFGDPFDAMANGWRGEGRALVLGGLMRGCAVAGRLAGCGGEVVIVEPGDALAADLGPRARWPMVQKLLARENVRVFLGAALEEVRAGGARIRGGEGGTILLENVSLIVPTRELIPQDALAASLSRAFPDLPVHPVGDCRLPRDAFAAVQEGAAAARRL